MVGRFLFHLKAYQKRCAPTMPTDKAGIAIYVPIKMDEHIHESKVVFMHGKDFSEYLPQGWKGRKIIQIFPNETVPVDTRICSWSKCLEDYNRSKEGADGDRFGPADGGLFDSQLKAVDANGLTDSGKMA